MIAGDSRDLPQNPPYFWNLPQGSHTWTPAALRTCTACWLTHLDYFQFLSNVIFPKFLGTPCNTNI